MLKTRRSSQPQPPLFLIPHIPPPPHTSRSRRSSDRTKYGLLEKKKDYVERARDFHKKEATIQRLRTKAAERNPDEFYFAMERARTKDGVHDGSLTRANKYSQDELRLMKTQDVKYIALKAQQEAKVGGAATKLCPQDILLCAPFSCSPGGCAR